MAILFVLCAARHSKRLTRWWDISKSTTPTGCVTNVVLRPILFTRGCNTFKKNMKVNGKKKYMNKNQLPQHDVIVKFILVMLKQATAKSYINFTVFT